MKRINPTNENPAGAPQGRWRTALVAAGALGVLLLVYGPALNGEFVFDDQYLPMTGPEFANLPIRLWLGVRPLLMFTFWANFKLGGLDTTSYHLFNVFCHFAVGVLVYFILRKLLELAGVSGWMRAGLAAFGGAVFLFHPVQSESVAYIASRSEVLSVLFCYGAFAVFLCRRTPAVGWLTALAVVVLFGAAVNTKEHTIVLVLLLLLTDYYWNPGFSFQGMKKNWRLYGLIAAGAVWPVILIRNVLRHADTAGFQVKGLPWYDYFYTQCRVIWTYIRLFVLPYGQTVDYDYPISRSPFEPAVLAGLLALVAAAVAAIWFRKRYPLASYGYFVFLLLLAPTSSVMPIADPIAERRMYLPLVGLILIALEFLRRWKATRSTAVAAMTVCVAALCWVSYARAEVWSGALPLWEDAAEKSPNKQRVQFQLGFAHFTRGACQPALDHFLTAGRVARPSSGLLVDTAMAYDCLGRRPEAVATLQRAATIRNTAQVQSTLGLIYIRMQKRAEAMAALDAAERLDPRYESTYSFRGVLYGDSGEWAAAAAEYRKALSINPANEAVRKALAEAEAHLGSGR